MIAADILEVTHSTNNNRYLLVVQDYFTKWVEAIALPDQTAVRKFTNELTKIFCTYGLPEILHSDQGRNFESTILAETLSVFGIKKSQTTAYHPQGDGMVERFNRSLLQFLQAYVDRENDWENYRCAIHSSTGYSPFQLMYGRTPSSSLFSPQTAFAAFEYYNHIQNKLAQLQDFVETNLAASASQQKSAYDHHTSARQFAVGDAVWLSVPTVGKLDPRWEGRWEITAIMSPTNVEITDGHRTRVVHIN